MRGCILFQIYQMVEFLIIYISFNKIVNSLRIKKLSDCSGFVIYYSEGRSSVAFYSFLTKSYD